MGRGNRKCICCGKEYNFCLHCAEYDHLPRWMNLWHNENCKELFNITNDYNAQILTKEEAKDMFAECDLSYKDKLHKHIIEAINEVNKSDKKVVEKKEK